MIVSEMVTAVASALPRIAESTGLVLEPETPSIPCFFCGVCCTRFRVNLSVIEARRICDGLGLNWYEFLSNYVEPSPAGADKFYLRQKDGACIFLKKRGNEPHKYMCLIHAWKPAACREWNASLHRKECQEGLLKYWELAVTTDGQLQGSAEEIQNFQAFLTGNNWLAVDSRSENKVRFLQG